MVNLNNFLLGFNSQILNILHASCYEMAIYWMGSDPFVYVLVCVWEGGTVLWLNYSHIATFNSLAPGFDFIRFVQPHCPLTWISNNTITQYRDGVVCDNAISHPYRNICEKEWTYQNDF